MKAPRHHVVSLPPSWIEIAYMVSKIVRPWKFGMFPSNLLKLRSLQNKKKKKVIRTKKLLNNCSSEYGKHKWYAYLLNETVLGKFWGAYREHKKYGGRELKEKEDKMNWLGKALPRSYFKIIISPLCCKWSHWNPIIMILCLTLKNN